MPSKKERAKLNASIASRFPQGSTKGDPLATTVRLGNGFRSVNSLQFSSKSIAKGLPIFSNK